MRVCAKCWQSKKDPEFYANTKSGWSSLCTVCRKTREIQRTKQQAIKQRALTRKLNAKKAKNEARYLRDRIRDLEVEFKRFTIANRAQIVRLQKQMFLATEGPDKRTIEALTKRRENQAKAQALLDYQIEAVKNGETPPDIYKLWSIHYGDDTGAEGQEPNQEDT